MVQPQVDEIRDRARRAEGMPVERAAWQPEPADIASGLAVDRGPAVLIAGAAEGADGRFGCRLRAVREVETDGLKVEHVGHRRRLVDRERDENTGLTLVAALNRRSSWTVSALAWRATFNEPLTARWGSPSGALRFR